MIDPRRSKTAEEADEHCFIRPATDAHFLAALVHVLFADDLVDLGTVAEWVTGVDEVRAVVEPFTPELVAPVCGIDADDDPPHRARARDRAERRRLRTHRYVHAGVRHARVVARRRAQRAHGQPRPPRRSDVREAGDRERDERRRSRPRARGAVRSPPVAGAWAAPSSTASCPRCASPRRSRHPARDRCARSSTIAGQPRRVESRCRAARPRVRVARLHGERRHLPQRDDAPRRT